MLLVYNEKKKEIWKNHNEKLHENKKKKKKKECVSTYLWEKGTTIHAGLDSSCPNSRNCS